MAIIQVRDLHKHFKVAVQKTGPFGAIRSLFSSEHTIKRAVDGVTFSVEKGEMIGYIGPNGAGKSTTIKMLTGILVPTAGEVTVAGLVPHQDRMRHVHHIGAVFGQKSQLWWDVPAIDTLLLLKEMYRVPEEAYKANIAMFHDLLDLHEFQNTPVRQLSLGQRMRADLAAALLHSPDILFLDEPTIGLDVVAKEKLRTFIKAINRERKVTVLLTTHDMTDIEKLCSRMLIIDHGRVIYDGRVDGMKEQLAPHRTLVVDFANGPGAVQSDRAELISQDGQRARYRFDRRVVSASELIIELASKAPVKDMTVEEPEIEAIVRQIYQRSGAGAQVASA